MKKYYVIMIMAMASFSSCEDFLDREPLSSISPEIYFTDASQVQAYVDDMYHVFFLIIRVILMGLMVQTLGQTIKLK